MKEGNILHVNIKAPDAGERMKEGKRVYVNMHVSISTHTLLTVLFFA